MARVKFYNKETGKWEYADSAFSSGGTVTDEQIASAVEDYMAEHPVTGGTVATVEPAEDDIPKVFFGGALQQTKDEKVVPFRYVSKTKDISGYAEIKAQGDSSMGYPKKNQTVKLFKDANCTEKLKVDFKGWGEQNKHVYKANWIDLTHARNIVSARLWGDVVKSRAGYMDLPELLRSSPNQGAVDGFPVKVYAAGVYQGRYTLNIPKDKWMANMDDELNEHCILCGEQSDSAWFRATANINGSDWSDEVHDTVPASIKTRWNEVISFVMHSTDDEFKANLSQYFYVDSLIDYYLFGLAICDGDGFRKNQIYMTYDGIKWLASAYDKDATWGLFWTGGKFNDTDFWEQGSKAQEGSGNLLYIRLERLFSTELQSRWAELKNGALSIENIINRFERFTDIASTELVKEDYASTTGGGAFTGIPSQTTNNIQQIRSFALARQAWVDEYVIALNSGGEQPDPEEPDVPEPSDIPCTGISLDKTTMTFTAEGTQTLAATVTPDGCTDVVTWESNNTNVATVRGGVVTAISNGTAVITAKCGEYSAACEVSVSIGNPAGHKNILATDLVANGGGDVLYEGKLNLLTEKVVAIIDLSTCQKTTGSGEGVFAVGTSASGWTTGNLYAFFNAGTKVLKFDDIVVQPNVSKSIKLEDITNLVIELTSAGIVVNGELISSDWDARRDSINSKTIKISTYECYATFKSVYIETI